MIKLTHRRTSDPKSGFWSPEEREKLVQKLGRIEHEAFDLIEEVCDRYCKWPDVFEESTCGEARLRIRCESCPLDKLSALIWEGPHETP